MNIKNYEINIIKFFNFLYSFMNIKNYEINIIKFFNFLFLFFNFLFLFFNFLFMKIKNYSINSTVILI
jgi:hypothetical protein